MGVDWTQLPGDLLINIARRCKCVEDLFGFFAVCSAWRAISTLVKPKWTPAIPWLMTPENSVNHPSCTWTVFDPSTYKSCKLELPETFGLSFCCRGDGNGWLFTVGPDMNATLFNPLTRAQICLPPAQKVKHSTIDQVPVDSSAGSHYLDILTQISRIRSVTLVKIPPDNGFLVLVLGVDDHTLVIAKPGSSTWSTMTRDNTHSEHTAVVDLIAFNGEILVLYADGMLIGISVNTLLCLHGTMDSESVPCKEYVSGDIHGQVLIAAPIPNIYLVESWGDILLVVRYVDPLENEEEDLFETVWFDVLIFDFGAKEWVSVSDLRDVTLFVGKGSALSLCSWNTNCKDSCIYFTDYRPEESKFRGHNTGIFHNRTWKTERLDQGNQSPNLFPQFWWMPNFSSLKQ